MIPLSEIKPGMVFYLEPEIDEYDDSWELSDLEDVNFVLRSYEDNRLYCVGSDVVTDSGKTYVFGLTPERMFSTAREALMSAIEGSEQYGNKCLDIAARLRRKFIDTP